LPIVMIVMENAVGQQSKEFQNRHGFIVWWYTFLSDCYNINFLFAKWCNQEHETNVKQCALVIISCGIVNGNENVSFGVLSCSYFYFDGDVLIGTNVSSFVYHGYYFFYPIYL